MRQAQHGGFVVGMIVGLLLGLGVALGVALYVTKVPVPFVNKVQQRTPEQDAAEVERNRNWDPNAPLHGRNPAKAPAAAAPPNPPAAIATQPPPAPASVPAARNPAALLADKAPAAPASSTKPGADPFTYFVQAGAYGRGEDAEQQRARLAMLGYPARITEREQSGRTVYRVRLGPFDKKDEADATKEKLAGNGVESALVRVQK